MADKTVKMLRSFAGKEILPAGSLQTMDEKQAAQYVDAGAAEYVEVKKRQRRRTTKKAAEARSEEE